MDGQCSVERGGGMATIGRAADGPTVSAGRPADGGSTMAGGPWTKWVDDDDGDRCPGMTVDVGCPDGWRHGRLTATGG